MKMNLLHRLSVVFVFNLLALTSWGKTPVYKVSIDAGSAGFQQYSKVSKLMTQSLKVVNLNRAYEQKIVWKNRGNKDYGENLELQVLPHPDGSNKSILRIHNKRPIDDVDWKVVEKVIEAPLGSDEWKSLTDKQLKRFFSFYDNREEIEKRVLVEGLKRDKGFVLKEGQIKIKCGEAISLAEARAEFLKKSKRNKNYLRAMIEIFANLGVSAARYYTTMYAVNTEDFDLPFSLDTQKRKWLFQELAMDSNSILTNSPGHPVWGASMYLSGKTNGLSSLESLLATTAALLIWENVAEFREKTSLNDIPFTTVASYAIGEGLYQLSEFFLTSGDSVPNKILGYVLNPSEALQRLLNGRKRPTYPDLDKHGFRKDIWYDFHVSSALSHAFNSSDSNWSTKGVAVQVDTKLFNDGTGNRLGKTEEFKFLGDSFLTETNLRAVLGGKGLQDFKWFLKAAYLGMYKKNLSQDEDGNLQGHSFLVSASSSYFHQFRNGRRVGDIRFNDFMGVVNLIGPSAEFVYARNGVIIRASLDLHGNFAAVRSYAFEKYDQNRQDAVTKDVLENQRYYYAYGITGNGKVSARYKGAELGGSYTYHDLRSIEGFDRFQDDIEDDFELADTQSVKRVWLKYKPFKDRALKLGLEFEQTDRSGTIRDLTVSDRENRINGSIIFHFDSL